MTLPSTCGECANAVFAHTPTGRINRNKMGRCSKEMQILSMFSSDKAPPCIVFVHNTLTGIWPDYPASHCPLREAIKETP